MTSLNSLSANEFNYIINFTDLPSKINCSLVDKRCALLLKNILTIPYNDYRISKFFPSEVINHITSFMTLPSKLAFRLICKNFDSCIINQKKILDDLENAFKEWKNGAEEDETKKKITLDKNIKLLSEIDHKKTVIKNSTLIIDVAGNYLHISSTKKIYHSLMNMLKGQNSELHSLNEEKDCLTKDLKTIAEKVEKNNEHCINAQKLFRKIKVVKITNK